MTTCNEWFSITQGNSVLKFPHARQTACRMMLQIGRIIQAGNGKLCVTLQISINNENKWDLGLIYFSFLFLFH